MSKIRIVILDIRPPASRCGPPDRSLDGDGQPDIILDTTPPSRLSDLVTAFLTAQAHCYLPNTLRAYGYDLGLLARSLPPELEAGAVKPQHLVAFLQSTAELAPATSARRQAAIRALLGWARRHGHIHENPADGLEPVRVPERNPRPLSEAQAEAILAAIPTKERRNRLLFTLLYETGMRVGEALHVHAEHVFENEVDGGFIRVLGKGGRERVVPLIDAPRTVRFLREALRRQGDAGPLFRGDVSKGGRHSAPLDYTTIFYHFERYVARARSRQPALFDREGDPITIHRLRHTYATMRLQDGVSLGAVRKLLGMPAWRPPSATRSSRSRTCGECCSAATRGKSGRSRRRRDDDLDHPR